MQKFIPLILFGLLAVTSCSNDEEILPQEQIVLDCGGDLLTDKWWRSLTPSISDVYFGSNDTALTTSPIGGNVINTWSCENDSNRIAMVGVDFVGYDATFTIVSLNDSILEANIMQIGGSRNATWKAE